MKEGQHITRVWQNWGRSTKFNICNSNEHLYKIQADVFQIPQLRQAPNRQAVKKMAF